MNSVKKFEVIVLSIVFVFLFYYSFNQFYSQHWTSILDQDPIIIYNSLLISSGVEQEYRDHPAYTTFLILGGLFKFLSIFFDSFKIESLMLSETIDDDFQILFYIARLLNTFYIFLCTLFIFKILKQFHIKGWISLVASILFIFHLSTFELLYLLRSEIVSVLFFLISIFYFLKSINTNNIYYVIVSGFFLCFSLLAKIQIIFLIFCFFASIPSIIKYLGYKEDEYELVLQKYNYKTAQIVISTFLLFYLFYHIFVGIIYLKETNNQIFFFNNNLDLYFFCSFVIFYKIYTFYLSKKKLINTKIVISFLSLIILGFILGVITIFLLDLLKIIPAHKSIFLRIMHPFEFMSSFTVKSKIEVINIFVTLKEFFLIGFYDLSYNFNIYHDHKVLGINARVFFRTLYIFIILILILISLGKTKNKSLNSLTLFFFGAILIYFLINNIRETHGYNIYIFPIFLFLMSLIFNSLTKKKVIFFTFIILTTIIMENYSFNNIHKNSFKLEPRVYDICKNTNPNKWTNSVNYFYNQLFSSPIVLVDDINWWFEKYLYQLHAVNNGMFFNRYCNQVNSFSIDKINFYFKKQVIN